MIPSHRYLFINKYLRKNTGIFLKALAPNVYFFLQGKYSNLD